MADVSNLVLAGGVDAPEGSQAGSEFMMPGDVMATPVTASSAAGSMGNGATSLPRVGKRGAPQAFARKLYEILTTESTDVIAWNAQGTAFHVKDVDTFSEQTLTRYYRHSKFSSFQRQLNLYSFRKIVKGPDTGGYAHPMFHRDRPDDLYHVRRSISSSSGSSPKNTARATGVEIHNSAVRKGTGRAAQKATTAAAWSSATGVPRAYKCKASARRVGKVRHAGNKVTKMRGTKKSPQQHAAAAAVVPSGGLADVAEGGERGAWTTGESSSDNESDPEMEGVDRSASTSDDEAGEGEEGDSSSDEGGEAEGSDNGRKQQQQQQQQEQQEQLLRGWARDSNEVELPTAAATVGTAAATAAAAGEGGDERRELSFTGLFSKRFSPHSITSSSRGGLGARAREGGGRGEGEGEGRTGLSSFFKKTFSGGSFSSFIEKV